MTTPKWRSPLVALGVIAAIALLLLGYAFADLTADDGRLDPNPTTVTLPPTTTLPTTLPGTATAPTTLPGTTAVPTTPTTPGTAPSGTTAPAPAETTAAGQSSLPDLPTVGSTP